MVLQNNDKKVICITSVAQKNIKAKTVEIKTHA